MSANLQKIESSPLAFEFGENNIRTMLIDGEPYFMGRDVAITLGYSRPRDAVSRHCRGAVKRSTPTSSGVQEMTYIPERDLYRLVMRSKLPEAEKFEEWVVGEVLPQIRKTGSFGSVTANLEDPASLRGLLLTYAEKAIELQTELNEAKPKLEAHDRIAQADGSLCITDAAKSLQLRPKDLFSFLQQHGWIYRRTGNTHWVSYQDKIVSGLMEHKVTTVYRSDGSEKITEQVRVTPKGLTRLAKLIPPAAELVA